LSGETWINMSGNPALAKGGSGDVLSGMIGAALARHAEPQAETAGGRKLHSTASLKDRNVAAAVYLHGLTADIARNKLHENSVLASDVLGNLWKGFRECERQKSQDLFYLQR
jgi:NAD(P)H-hydrate epimerase